MHPKIQQRQFNVNYLYTLALDHTYGIITDPEVFLPDFFTRNQSIFKTRKTGSDPDTPSVMEALTGPHRDGFLDTIQLEITELEHHNTWKVIKRSDIPKKQLSDGTTKTF